MPFWIKTSLSETATSTSLSSTNFPSTLSSNTLCTNTALAYLSSIQNVDITTDIGVGFEVTGGNATWDIVGNEGFIVVKLYALES